MQQPRCVFLVGSLALLLLLLLAFTGYHIYLVCINQTTNERFKLSVLQVDNNNANESSKTPITAAGNFYNRGFLLNLLEVFCPQYMKKKQFSGKEKSNSINGQTVQTRTDLFRQRGKRK